jgi:hypothetical protein
VSAFFCRPGRWLTHLLYPLIEFILMQNCRRAIDAQLVVRTRIKVNEFDCGPNKQLWKIGNYADDEKRQENHHDCI